ncbi:MAG TPA: SDR family oxidoreductase [Thermoanaerobaculia bacterium]|nr:SDR family oxidoreductase [Thermoanaerobaculia bacterium]
MGEFNDRVVVITGASSGIGRRTAERFVEAGARVAVFARRGDSLLELASQAPLRILAIPGDVGDESAVDRLFDETESQFGPVDIVANCAGIVDPKPVAETTVAEWDRMFAVHVRGIFLTSRRAIRSMRTRGGAIVNVASISGIPGPQKFPGFVSYCASKGAVIALTEALAVELKEEGIRVNAVSPGSVETPMLRQASSSLVPEMTADEVAEVILFLASERSRPINGQNLHVFSA